MLADVRKVGGHSAIRRAIRLDPLCSKLVRLGFESFDCFRLVDHKARMHTADHGVDLILNSDHERHLPAANGHDLDGNFHIDAGERRGDVSNRDRYADVVLISIGVGEDYIAAGRLDFSDQVGCEMDEVLLAHGTDGLCFPDDNTVHRGETGHETRFHSSRFSPLNQVSRHPWPQALEATTGDRAPGTRYP
jgi:hypothetical protein